MAWLSLVLVDRICLSLGWSGTLVLVSILYSKDGVPGFQFCKTAQSCCFILDAISSAQYDAGS